jgi:hypothetical protein
VPLLPAAKCSGSAFTAGDGDYYGLAQLTGADPSLFGCADQIETANDPGDGSSVFYLRTDGGNSPGVLQVYNGKYLLGYDIGVTFAGAFTALAELWIGFGVGGGTYAYEYVRLENPTDASPTLRLTGAIWTSFPAFGPTANGQRFGGVLLCTGAAVNVDETWCYVTALANVADVQAIVP